MDYYDHVIELVHCLASATRYARLPYKGHVDQVKMLACYRVPQIMLDHSGKYHLHCFSLTATTPSLSVLTIAALTTHL